MVITNKQLIKILDLRWLDETRGVIKLNSMVPADVSLLESLGFVPAADFCDAFGHTNLVFEATQGIQLAVELM